jgi:DNA-binding transcriptional LysR family regulator
VANVALGRKAADNPRYSMTVLLRHELDSGALRNRARRSIACLGECPAFPAYPGFEVTFTLREMATSAIERAVASGEIDLGLLREATPGPPLASRILYNERVVAVLPRAHRLAARKSLRLGDLRNDPFIFFPKRLGPALHDRLMGHCVAAGFTANIVEEATQWQTIISLIEAGMGVTLAPACVRKFRWPQVVFKALPGLTTSVAACWPETAISPTAASFLKMAKSKLNVTP